MMTYLTAAAFVAITFTVLDFVWLGILAKGFYAGQIGHLMRDPIHWPGAIAFYIMYVVGVVFFAVAPTVQDGDWQRAALLGGALGLFGYGTYNLTNLATLRGWPIPMVLIDMSWGIALTAAVAGIACAATHAVS